MDSCNDRLMGLAVDDMGTLYCKVVIMFPFYDVPLKQKKILYACVTLKNGKIGQLWAPRSLCALHAWTNGIDPVQGRTQYYNDPLWAAWFTQDNFQKTRSSRWWQLAVQCSLLGRTARLKWRIFADKKCRWWSLCSIKGLKGLVCVILFFSFCGFKKASLLVGMCSWFHQI